MKPYTLRTNRIARIAPKRYLFMFQPGPHESRKCPTIEEIIEYYLFANMKFLQVLPTLVGFNSDEGHALMIFALSTLTGRKQLTAFIRMWSLSKLVVHIFPILETFPIDRLKSRRWDFCGSFFHLRRLSRLLRQRNEDFEITILRLNPMVLPFMEINR